MSGNVTQVLGTSITAIDYLGLAGVVNKAVVEGRTFFITYATAHTLNLSYESVEFRRVLSEFNLIHPDGMGAYLAQLLLSKNRGKITKITGSDFYPHLKEISVAHNRRLYIFGDTKNTCLAVCEKLGGIIAGYSAGYSFDTQSVISDIEKTNPDIILVGLGAPNQEVWVIENKEALRGRVVICVGDGLKVLAGTKKRGPIWMQKAGLEWLVRLYFEPGRLWKRYLSGNLLFIFRIVRQKFSGRYD